MADLSNRYASALFSIAKESDILEDVATQAELVVTTITDTDALRVLLHPHITAQEKNTFLSEAFGAHVHESLQSFMRLAVNKNRQAFLLPALSRFSEMVREHQGRTTAKIVSAVPLTNEQLQRITSTLGRKLGKTVDATVLVDPTVIAGLSIQVDCFYLDRTIKTMLKAMKETVSKGAQI
jgi:F-type H+-transporting ATPase subunit delta